MKKRFLALLLTLALSLSLATPAFADIGYVPLDTTPEWLEWKAVWTAANPDALAAFDPDLWFDQHYRDYYTSQEEYMTGWEIPNREEFEAYMAQEWLRNLRYHDELIQQTEKYAARYPDEYAAFDPDAWVETSWYNDREGYKTVWQVGDATFEAHMWSEYALTWHNEEITAAQLAEFKAAHPEEYAAFDAAAHFDRVLKDDYSKAEYMAMLDITTEEAFFDAMLLWYINDLGQIQGYKDRWAALRAEAPERTALFLTELDGWLRDRYYGVSSLAEYMDEYGIVCAEEGYTSLYHDWNTEYEAAQEAARVRDAFLTGRGGVPGGLNVMLDGKFLTFPAGRAPYAKDGVVYADAATLADALSMEIPAPIDGYASIRKAAELAGHRVFWDGEYNSVVLLNTTALAAQVDKDYTILNGLLSKWKTDLTKNYKSGVKAKADVTLFDSLDGDKTSTMTYNLDLLYSARGLQMTGKYDAGKLMDLFLATLEGNPYGPDAEQLAQVKTMAKGDFECRLDFDNAMAYMRASAFDLMPQLTGEMNLPAGSWIAAPLEGLDFASLRSAPATTYGSILCNNIASAPAWLASPVTYYDSVLETPEDAKAVLSDSAFTKSGQNYTTTLDGGDLAALTGLYSLPDQFDLTLTIRPDGGVLGKLYLNQSSYYDGPTTRVTADFSLSLASQRLTLEVHNRNVFKVEVTLTGATTTTTQSPALTPPAGANVVEP